jgi:hypothetical protein
MSRIIRNIESIVTTAAKGGLQLDKDLSLIVGLTNSIVQASSIWADAIASVETAQAQYQAWLVPVGLSCIININKSPIRNDAGLLTDEVLQALASRWDTHGMQTMYLTQSALRTRTSIIQGSFAASAFSTSSKSTNSTLLGTPSKASPPAMRTLIESTNDPKVNAFMQPTTVEDRIKTFQALYRGNPDSLVYELIKAPSFSLGVNREELVRTADSYRSAANMMS